MRHKPLFLVALLIAGVALSGCVGGDDGTDPSTDDTTPDATPTAETGAVKGQVVTQSLDEVGGASVALMSGAEIVVDTTTDKAGRFVFNGVTPGDYRVQVSSICCKPALKSVKVEANKIADVGFQLEILTADDLQQPYVKPDSWEGFISCGASFRLPDPVGQTLADQGAPRGLAAAVCSFPGIVDESLEDPNEAFMYTFNVSAGLKTLLIGMVWEPVGGVAGGELSLAVENAGTGLTSEEGNTYADVDGGSPIIIRLDNDDIEEDKNKWDNITESRNLQYRIFSTGNNVVYQQPFTIYWDAYYWAEAPEDATPIPDQ